MDEQQRKAVALHRYAMIDDLVAGELCPRDARPFHVTGTIGIKPVLLGAAIFVSESEVEALSGIQDLVQTSLTYVDTPLTEISIILGVIGFIYLLWSEIEQLVQKKA